MDKKQLELINATEKGYELREHSGQKMVLESGEVFEKVYAYFVPEALLWEGQMIRFPDIPGTSPLPAIWQADMLNEVRERIDFMGTREEFIHLLRWDFAFREQVELFLKKHACEFDHADWKPLEKIASIGEMNRSFK